MITEMQRALRDHGLDGWLFVDQRRRDPLSYRLLRLSDSLMASRRWYYLIPADGEPQKLVHRIEQDHLDSLPGQKYTYAGLKEQLSQLTRLLRAGSRMAMQYSPLCTIPYISNVDAGLLELIRDCGVIVVSSADLVQQFDAVWTEEQLEMHQEAGRLVDEIRRGAFTYISEALSAKRAVHEYEVQQVIRTWFKASNLDTDHGPVVAVNQNASNPHYEPAADVSAPIAKNDLVLIDLWAKLTRNLSVYYDSTWVGFCGDSVPEQIAQVFATVRDARKHACQFVIESMEARQQVRGWQVDDAARNYIAAAGYGDYFIHRTGHSIGTEVHGTGANMDNLESHDERHLIPQTCFSVEPGIYLQNFGIRSEVDVYVGVGYARVTGEQQEELVKI